MSYDEKKQNTIITLNKNIKTQWVMTLIGYQMKLMLRVDTNMTNKMNITKGFFILRNISGPVIEAVWYEVHVIWTDNGGYIN